MPTQDAASAPFSGQDLKTLLTAVPPCVTILIALPEPGEAQVRLKNALRGARQHLRHRHLDAEGIDALLAPVQTLARTIALEGRWGSGLAILRSPSVFRHFWIPELAAESVTVAGEFSIRPLLPLLGNLRTFYVLALSRKEVRLYRSSGGGWERVILPESIPTDLTAWLHTRQPDHALENRASAGPSTGSMTGVMFGTATERESRDQFLLHFFKEIDRGIHTLVKDPAALLVLAGVEHEVALYRKVNSYPRLVEGAVYGSPESGEADLRERALHLVRQHVPEPLRAALAQLERYRGSPRVRFDLQQILQAAQRGRVADLFLPAETPPGKDDPANRAAIQTLLHGGQVFVLGSEQAATQAVPAAVMRY